MHVCSYVYADSYAHALHVHDINLRTNSGDDSDRFQQPRLLPQASVSSGKQNIHFTVMGLLLLRILLQVSPARARIWHLESVSVTYDPAAGASLLWRRSTPRHIGT